MGRQLQSKESFPFLVDRIPPPTPFETVAAVGASQWKSHFGVFAERGGRAAAESCRRWGLCSSAATSQARSGPSGVLLQAQEDTLATWGGSPPRQGTLGEPNRRSIGITASASTCQSTFPGRGWEARSFLAGPGTHLVLLEQRAHLGARPHTRSCQHVGARALPGPPRPPARPHPAARWPPPSLAQAHAAPGSPWRCHGGREQLQWALGQPCDPRRGELCQ